MDYSIGMNGQQLLGVFTFFITTYLGGLVYVRNYQSWTGRLFLLLSALVDVYIVVNYISLHPLAPTPESQLFWIRVVMFVTSFIGPTLVCLVHTFPQKNFSLPKKFLVPLLCLMLVSAVFSLTPLVFSGITYPNGQPVPVPGPGIPVFFVDFVGMFILSFGILIYKFRRSIGKERSQILYFLLGVVSTFSFMAISTVVAVVVLHSSAGVFLGPVSSVILMTFIAYAIFKYNLFNIKIIATETLVFLLIIILLLEACFSGSVPTAVFKLFFATLVAIIGSLLIRSVHKEISQREELVDLANSLERANIRLQELDRQKTEFLSIASHQLRTPLSVVNGYIELILDKAYGHVGSKMKTVLHNMDESNGRLIKLVDEFLDVTRIEQGRTKFIFKQDDLVLIIKSVVDELENRALQKGLKIIRNTPRNFMAVFDEDKIRHVIFNFVDNAIKYSEKGSIKIMISEEDEGVAVRVIDSGLGFNQQDEVNFFQKFYRGENVKGVNVNGTGLGLYVCRMFIEAHKGKCWAKSKGLGKGGEFGFWLPLNLPEITISGEAAQ